MYTLCVIDQCVIDMYKTITKKLKAWWPSKSLLYSFKKKKKIKFKSKYKIWYNHLRPEAIKNQTSWRPKTFIKEGRLLGVRERESVEGYEIIAVKYAINKLIWGWRFKARTSSNSLCSYFLEPPLQSLLGPTICDSLKQI